MTKQNNMKIIAIEGLDKAGKKTATDTLEQYFESKGLIVARTGYPNYDTPTGKLVGQWLKGEFQADEKTFELLQAADKQLGQDYIKQCEENGVEVLLIDRYIHSELAYGAYDNDEEWLQELVKYMRKPDYVVYMEVEPEVSMHRRGKFGDNDRYEADLDRLRYTKREYECLFKENEASDFLDYWIDANLPPLIVKAQVLKTAGILYTAITGNELVDYDTLDHVTAEESALIKSWYHSTESAPKVVSAKPVEQPMPKGIAPL